MNNLIRQSIKVSNKTVTGLRCFSTGFTKFTETPMGVFADQLFLQPVNPATERPIKDIKIDTRATLTQKFERAYLYKKEWKYVSQTEKANMIIKFRDLLVEKVESLANDLTEETGKPITQSKNEIKAVVDRINFFLYNFSSCLAERSVRTTDNFRESLSYEPLGVVGNISAWNYPFFIGLNTIIPALLTGNTVLYKPSEFASITGVNIMNLLYEAGVPESAFQIVLGKSVIGQSMLSLPLDGLFFTGSYNTGKHIAETLGGRMIKTQLELGGKDAAYVHKNVDIKAAARSLADGAMYNTGQSCCSVERIYVDKEIYAEFVVRLTDEVAELQMGIDPKSASTYFGPLTRGPAQIEHMLRLVSDAVVRGAQIALGGGQVKGTPGYFFSPTIIVDVDHSMAVTKEEIFGPMVTVQPVSGPQEAAELMNDTPYGLTGSVYTNDASVADFICDQSNTGTVYWNACDRVSPYLPWSGRGHSGIGSTLGVEGIFSFLKPKARHYISDKPGAFGEPSNSNIVPTQPISKENISQFIEESYETNKKN
ncbi:aldehyde dehydrogenase [Cavenderia fasciculata]|uniref:Aldehyde dehydrogenase n=1 Tax=Cavenderia fasciculata TaxID=261658 RepID=F4PKH2_CACFS|nr:aldehyde dehydrogenase [Cavenderia fasciculata]EGG24096.1 aldehyde dehydrogenase [Cavenderia fasciculata]|eukprot:XP_004361947.1 aldehyde dehydrogenase [Cavenderia fasciculata]